MLAVQASTIGPAPDVGSARTGVVHSVFRHAVNVVVETDLWTLLARDQSDLPFGVRTVLNDCSALGAIRGEGVAIRAGFIGIGDGAPRAVVDCRTAARWHPAALRAAAPRLDRRVALLAAVVAERCWSGSAAMAERIATTMRDEPHSLAGVLAQVVGRGPGLTPSGDDVLVGMFAALRLAPSAHAVAHSHVLSRALEPHLTSTTDLSTHLLRQAARGLFGRVLHELISALADDTPHELMSERIARVVAVGATSGADACAGILAIARHFRFHPGERAAA